MPGKWLVPMNAKNNRTRRSDPDCASIMWIEQSWKPGFGWLRLDLFADQAEENQNDADVNRGSGNSTNRAHRFRSLSGCRGKP